MKKEQIIKIQNGEDFLKIDTLYFKKVSMSICIDSYVCVFLIVLFDTGR